MGPHNLHRIAALGDKSGFDLLRTTLTGRIRVHCCIIIITGHQVVIRWRGRTHLAWNANHDISTRRVAAPFGTWHVYTSLAPLASVTIGEGRTPVGTTKTTAWHTVLEIELT